MPFLISFCNLGQWCSRYALGIAEDDFRTINWVKIDDCIAREKDVGVTGIHVFDGGVLICIQSSIARVAWLHSDLRLHRVFSLIEVKDPHSITVRGHEALIVCSSRNRLFSLDLRTGAERCVFAAHDAETDVVHLNGVAMHDGRAIVSYFGEDIAGEQRVGGIIDSETKVAFASGILQPHSPTVYDDEVYVLGSEDGLLYRFGRDKREVHKLGGYLRGLSVLQNTVVVGRSAWRAGHRRLGGLRHKLGPEVDPHNNPWQRSAILLLNRTTQIVDSVDVSFFGPEIYDIANIETSPPPSRVFDEAKYRRLDALQESQVRLTETVRNSRAR